jgi:hypothetical protein
MDRVAFWREARPAAIAMLKAHVEGVAAEAMCLQVPEGAVASVAVDVAALLGLVIGADDWLTRPGARYPRDLTPRLDSPRGRSPRRLSMMPAVVVPAAATEQNHRHDNEDDPSETHGCFSL